jgi:OmpA-OmpF porin, OOP family
MDKKMNLPGTLLTVSALAFSAAATSAFAQVPGDSGYLIDARGNAVRAAVAGVCVKTNYWTPAHATAECDPDLLPRGRS